MEKMVLIWILILDQLLHANNSWNSVSTNLFLCSCLLSFKTSIKTRCLHSSTLLLKMLKGLIEIGCYVFIRVVQSHQIHSSIWNLVGPEEEHHLLHHHQRFYANIDSLVFEFDEWFLFNRWDHLKQICLSIFEICCFFQIYHGSLQLIHSIHFYSELIVHRQFMKDSSIDMSFLKLVICSSIFMCKLHSSCKSTPPTICLFMSAINNFNRE